MTSDRAPGARGPDSLPDPRKPAGAVNDEMPFDHIIVAMMENHSFDNVLGALSLVGQAAADGLTFDSAGQATNSNPGTPDTPAEVTAFPLTSTVQGPHVSQSWNATHEQIDGGKMDGFVKSVGSIQPMGYFPPRLLPFAYSLAATFTVANRWFCSAPCQTIPNRRFLLAGTAYGAVATDVPTLFDGSPPNGTIIDRPEEHGISWSSAFRSSRQSARGSLGTEAMRSAAGHGVRRGCRASHRSGRPPFPSLAAHPSIYTYDEHGGYYDHVPPPAAPVPDAIPPKLSPTDAPGGYNMYGPRVPAVVVSPYSRPNAVTNVVHDHTSVLATIETKWNLPALTHRDANAATVMDFLDASHPAFLSPPAISGPSPTRPSAPSG